MRTRKLHILRWIAVALVAAAMAAPAAPAAGVSPDDRPFYRGASEALAPTSLSPDDRPFARSVGEIEPASLPVEFVLRPRSFDWEDAGIGATFGLVLALLGTGAILIAQRRRSTLRTT